MSLIGRHRPISQVQQDAVLGCNRLLFSIAMGVGSEYNLQHLNTPFEPLNSLIISQSGNG